MIKLRVTSRVDFRNLCLVMSYPILQGEFLAIDKSLEFINMQLYISYIQLLSSIIITNEIMLNVFLAVALFLPGVLF